jgi:hypothetical protein
MGVQACRREQYCDGISTNAVHSGSAPQILPRNEGQDKEAFPPGRPRRLQDSFEGFRRYRIWVLIREQPAPGIPDTNENRGVHIPRRLEGITSRDHPITIVLGDTSSPQINPVLQVAEVSPNTQARWYH